MSLKEISPPSASAGSAAREQLLLQRLGQALQAADAIEPTIARHCQDGSVPLSFAQQRLWFLDQLHPGSPLYNMTMAVRLDGTLHPSALREAIGKVVERHQILRTRFFSERGEPHQEVFAVPRFSMPEIDLSGLPIEKRQTELQQRLEAEARQPFNLSGDLLLRATLYRLAADKHVLFLNMHHIASDAASFGVFFDEISRFYESSLAGEPVVLPDLPIQYADYVLWQRQELDKSLQTHLEYWKQHLAGAPDLLELPTTHPRPARPSSRGGREGRQLDPGLADQLQKLSRCEGVTPFVLLLAAFTVLLHRFTRQDDILVGIPVAGRHHVETEPLIGFFINTLALRSRLEGNPSFRELLKRARATILKAHAHQELPFEKLVEELRPQRASSHEPLIQTMFVYQAASKAGMTLPGLKAAFHEIGTGTAKFDLMLTVTDTAPGLLAEIEYKSDLFDRDTIARWLSHFEVLLAGIAANPDHPVRQIPLLTDSERHRLLVEWNDTRTDFPRDRCVHELFEEQARISPAATAVIFKESRLTYGELNACANRLARDLQETGVKPGMIVGIFVNRSLEMIIGLLAILKAGGAYAPLDPSSPPERLAGMLEDLEARILLTQSSLKQVLLRSTSRNGSVPPLIFCLDTDCTALACQKADDFPCPVSAESLAYVSFTSGSTGRPKGVCLPHRGIVRLVRNANYASFSPSEVFLQLAPVPFDASLFEIWGALLNGARLVVLPPHAPSFSELAEAIQTNGVTTLWLTSGLFSQLVEAKPECLCDLRQVLAGGDVISPPHVRKALAYLRAGRLINGYGPSENATFTTCYEVPRDFDGQRAVPVGRPISNTECYLLDDQMQPVPIGIPGELYAGGDGLAKGYLKQPGLTAERFIPNPFRSGTYLYKTGDLARYLSDGNIEFLGRIDTQVKIRGYRVELGEIESAILQHPEARECAVTARADTDGQKRLTAYVVPERSLAPATSEWQEFLRQRLPEYMVPSAFVVLPGLPLSPNGKVDRKALPIPETEVRTGANSGDPKDNVERQLCQLWEESLKKRLIGVRDNFFGLGGHSLLAMRLLARIEEQFNAKISVSQLFQHPTIEQLAAILRDGPGVNSNSLIVPIQPHGSNPPLVFIHGVGGGMFWGYGNLARFLGPDQPVFAIKSRGLDGEEEFSTIEGAAEQYIAQLRAFQPHGPYYLGGYCFGGVVAYEMACRLHAQGEKIALLALINSSPPNSSYTSFRWTPATFFKFTKNLCVRAACSLRAAPEKRRAFLRWKFKVIARRLKERFSPAPSTPPMLDADELLDLSQHSEPERNLWQTHVRALMNYHAGVYPGHVTLFRSPVHLMYCSFDPTYGWGQLASGGVTVKVIPGAHETIMEMPQVQKLAAELSAACAGHPTAVRGEGREFQQQSEPQNTKADEAAVL